VIPGVVDARRSLRTGDAANVDADDGLILDLVIQ
jgi:hypothetical protein